MTGSFFNRNLKILDKHFVYILACSDKTLYTGYTNDLNKRIKTHNRGLGAKYTKARLPVKLVYYEIYSNKSEAMKREYEIKQLSRLQKIELIEMDDFNVISNITNRRSD